MKKSYVVANERRDLYRTSTLEKAKKWAVKYEKKTGEKVKIFESWC